MSQPELNQTSYQFLRDYIAEQTGIELGPDRQYLVETRLQPIMEDLQCNSLSDLCRVLMRENLRSRSNPDAGHSVQNRVIHALSTHETSFFRDPECFDALRTVILPRLLSTNNTGRLKCWSAAASSGQEAYSLAMLCAEMTIYPLPYIFATDVSRIVLDVAAQGYYSTYELQRGLQNARLLEKYFIARPGGAEVVPAIRKSIEFACMDLRVHDPRLRNFDLVLCRNVLIYFDEPTRLRVLDHLFSALRPGGVLLMGAAETIWADLPEVEREQSGNTTFFTKKS